MITWLFYFLFVFSWQLISLLMWNYAWLALKLTFRYLLPTFFISIIDIFFQLSFETFWNLNVLGKTFNQTESSYYFVFGLLWINRSVYILQVAWNLRSKWNLFEISLDILIKIFGYTNSLVKFYNIIYLNAHNTIYH